jgi:hypothetical protein
LVAVQEPLTAAPPRPHDVPFTGDGVLPACKSPTAALSNADVRAFFSCCGERRPGTGLGKSRKLPLLLLSSSAIFEQRCCLKIEH